MEQEVKELRIDLDEYRRRLEELNQKFERDIAIINQKIRNTHKYFSQIHREYADEYTMDYRTPQLNPIYKIIVNDGNKNRDNDQSCCSTIR